MSIYRDKLPLDILSIVIDAMETDYECDQIEAHHTGECLDENGVCTHITLEDYWEPVTTIELEFQPELGEFIITDYS